MFNASSRSLPLRHIFRPIILTCVNTNVSQNSSLIFHDLSVVFAPNALRSPLVGLWLALVSLEGRVFTLASALPSVTHNLGLSSLADSQKQFTVTQKMAPFRSSRAAENEKKRQGPQLHRRSCVIGWRRKWGPENWANKNNSARGAFETRVRLQVSSGNAEVIRVRKAGRNKSGAAASSSGGAATNSGWLSVRALRRSWWEALFTGRGAVSTGRLGGLELDEFIKGSAVSPSCRLCPCSQTPINGRNTSKTTFSTRPRKQGYI